MDALSLVYLGREGSGMAQIFPRDMTGLKLLSALASKPKNEQYDMEDLIPKLDKEKWDVDHINFISKMKEDYMNSIYNLVKSNNGKIDSKLLFTSKLLANRINSAISLSNENFKVFDTAVKTLNTDKKSDIESDYDKEKCSIKLNIYQNPERINEYYEKYINSDIDKDIKEELEKYKNLYNSLEGDKAQKIFSFRAQAPDLLKLDKQEGFDWLRVSTKIDSELSKRLKDDVTGRIKAVYGTGTDGATQYVNKVSYEVPEADFDRILKKEYEYYYNKNRQFKKEYQTFDKFKEQFANMYKDKYLIIKEPILGRGGGGAPNKDKILFEQLEFNTSRPIGNNQFATLVKKTIGFTLKSTEDNKYTLHVTDNKNLFDTSGRRLEPTMLSDAYITANSALFVVAPFRVDKEDGKYYDLSKAKTLDEYNENDTAYHLILVGYGTYKYAGNIQSTGMIPYVKANRSEIYVEYDGKKTRIPTVIRDKNDILKIKRNKNIFIGDKDNVGRRVVVDLQASFGKRSEEYKNTEPITKLLN